MQVRWWSTECGSACRCHDRRRRMIAAATSSAATPPATVAMVAGAIVRAASAHPGRSMVMCGLPVSSAETRLVRAGSRAAIRPWGPCSSARRWTSTSWAATAATVERPVVPVRISGRSTSSRSRCPLLVSRPVVCSPVAVASAVSRNVHRVLEGPDDASQRCRPREDARYELRAAPCETPPGSRDHPGNVPGHRTSSMSRSASMARYRVQSGDGSRADPRMGAGGSVPLVTRCRCARLHRARPGCLGRRCGPAVCR